MTWGQLPPILLIRQAMIRSRAESALKELQRTAIPPVEVTVLNHNDEWPMRLETA
jgi:hypothetical protein